MKARGYYARYYCRGRLGAHTTAFRAEAYGTYIQNTHEHKNKTCLLVLGGSLINSYSQAFSELDRGPPGLALLVGEAEIPTVTHAGHGRHRLTGKIAEKAHADTPYIWKPQKKGS